MPDYIARFQAQREADKPYDSSDPVAVNNARKAAAHREASDLETLKELMRFENGRSLVFDMVKCCFNGNPMVFESAEATAFNLGQEATARRTFYKIIRVCPKEFCEMVDEHHEEIGM